MLAFIEHALVADNADVVRMAQKLMQARDGQRPARRPRAGNGEALEPGHPLRLWPPDARTDVRYELQASIRMIDATVPFTASERQALTDGPLQAFLDARRGVFSDEALARHEHRLADHEPELVARWHQWLWQDELDRPQTNVRAMGASAVLAHSYEQLASSLYIILADPESSPL